MSTEPIQLREYFDDSVLGVIGIDMSGQVHMFSFGAEQTFGYKAREMIGNHISLLMPALPNVALNRYLRLSVVDKETQVTGSSWNFQARHANGTHFNVVLHLDRTNVDGVPMIIGTIMGHRDHEHARYLLDEFFDLSLELHAVATFDGHFIRLNPVWESILGYPTSELLAHPITHFIHPDDKEVTTEVIKKLSSGGEVEGFENRYLASDGSVRSLEWTAKSAPNWGLIMASAHDVSRRHRVEMQLRAARDEAKEASRSKSEFLSRMSHELRTPLNSVLGFAQLLAMDDLDAEQQENLNSIQRSGKHLLDMINEVLDISQIEAGMLRLSLSPVSVAEVLSVALDLIAPQASEREIQIPASVEEEGIYVLADQQKLLQVLLNVLSNAVKYNRHGGSVTIELQASGGTVSIGVSDTGNGLTNAQMSSVFKPFERLGAETSSVEGTGVGLSLSKALSQQMNGALTVASQIGVGSTFFLELPEASSVERQSEVEGEAATVTSPSSAGNITVLYVEDNIANSELMERALKTQGGVSLVTAVQGSIGLDLATQLEPDLVLLDLHLPDISGDEVLRRIRATASIADTTVVVCSADASPGQVRRLVDDGADGYLTKPIDLTDLFEVVRRVRAHESIDNPARHE